MAEKKENISFEDAMTALEGAVTKLENGSLTLDEAISTFEEAISLIKVCNTKLSEAEQKVKILVESSDGAITDMPFNGTGDEA